MRNFYITYKDIENLAPLVREISWTKNIVITEKCKDNPERELEKALVAIELKMIDNYRLNHSLAVAVFSLALVIDGIPNVGVVYDPFTDSLYTAIK